MSARDVRNVWIVSLVMALHAVAAEEESRIKPGHNLLQEADHRPAICQEIDWNECRSRMSLASPTIWKM